MEPMTASPTRMASLARGILGRREGSLHDSMPQTDCTYLAPGPAPGSPPAPPEPAWPGAGRGRRSGLPAPEHKHRCLGLETQGAEECSRRVSHPSRPGCKAQDCPLLWQQWRAGGRTPGPGLQLRLITLPVTS
ncbi:hypothetical protein MC885_011228 [Smutsia gigantea]|nr:hypothetical protein MC885_011228 [Smutsia gigantea]